MKRHKSEIKRATKVCGNTVRNVFLPRTRQEAIAAFEQQFLKDEQTGCWNWTACKNSRGYGKWSWKKLDAAHRFSFRFYRGGIPKGKSVCHSCDNPGCVNPDHLWIGTHTQNMQDMMRKDRMPRGENHPSTKLTDAQVLEIRTRTAKGETHTSIARELNVVRQTISKIASGKYRIKAVLPQKM